MTIILTDYVLGEVERNMETKWPHKMQNWQNLPQLRFSQTGFVIPTIHKNTGTYHMKTIPMV